jgi:hypothetical protein
MELSFPGRRFVWTFLLADVQFDFLRSHQLLVDPAVNRLLDTASLLSTTGLISVVFFSCSDANKKCFRIFSDNLSMLRVRDRVGWGGG